MHRLLRVLVLVAIITIAPSGIHGQRTGASSPIIYKVTFPEAEHHWMQVEAIWTNLGTQSFDARMSRSSPGRYAVAEFAKNVFSVEAFDGKGKKLATTRPDADVWRIADHDGTVRVVYKIFGDFANGTFFGVDATHAHLQMPAAFMWGVGHDYDALRITFVPPDGSHWKVGTQLYSTGDENTFTAPNLQYFMDSPTELSDFIVSSFTIPNSDGAPANFRLVVHSDSSQSDVDELAKLVERLVREQMTVFGEFPKYEPGNYSFLLDYVSWAVSDGMEHRNSTSISTAGLSLRTPQGRQQALGAISHEYFHNWNMERIRAVGIEPFDFTRENVTCCLWEGEGFTQYYGPLLLTRAGLGGGRGGGTLVGSAIPVINAPGRAVRSPVEMSEYAPFADGNGTFADTTDSNRTFLSYYTYGAGIALALDFSLREMTGSRLSLDDYMKLLWQQHGKPGGPVPGVVARPYTLKDLRDHLATLTANRKFADDFFDRYIEGREAPDYERLLALAGYTLQMAPSGKGWIGNIPLRETPNGLAIGGTGLRLSPIPFGTPIYEAGIDAGDVIKTIDGQPATLVAWNSIASKKPGEFAVVDVMRRDGTVVAKTITVRQDPTAQSVVAVESLPGRSLSAAQSAFRETWLSSKAN